MYVPAAVYVCVFCPGPVHAPPEVGQVLAVPFTPSPKSIVAAPFAPVSYVENTTVSGDAPLFGEAMMLAVGFVTVGVVVAGVVVGAGVVGVPVVSH